MPFPVSPNPGDSYTDAYGTVWIYAGPVNGWYRQTVIPSNETSYTAGLITTDKIIDNTIINADVASNAAIAGTKISPNFGSQNVTTTGTSTAASFIPTSSTVPTNGVYLPAANSVALSTSGTGKLFIDSAGKVTVKGAGTAAFVVEGSAPNNSLVIKDTTGNVGIGASDPQRPLDVVSNSSAETVTFRGASANNISTLRFNSNNAATNYASIQSRPTFFELATASGIPLLLSPGSGTGVGIGTTTPGTPLNVQGVIRAQRSDVSLGTGIRATQIGCETGLGSLDTVGNDGQFINLVFRQSSDGSTYTERARIDSSGRLLIGTSSARANFFNTSVSAGIQLEAAGDPQSINRRASIIYGDTSGYGPYFILGTHRSNSIGGTTVVQSGDELGGITFQGSDGTEFVEGARIQAFVDGTPGANDMPGRLVFSTTADGASSPTERMRIKANGTINFSNVAVYADNAAATTGGLAVGDVYRTSTGQLMIRY